MEGGALCFSALFVVDDFRSGRFDVSPGSERCEGSGIKERRGVRDEEQKTRSWDGR